MNDLDCVFITNDDGLCTGLEDLISNLHEFKIPLLVVVPSENKYNPKILRKYFFWKFNLLIS